MNTNFSDYSHILKKIKIKIEKEADKYQALDDSGMKLLREHINDVFSNFDTLNIYQEVCDYNKPQIEVFSNISKATFNGNTRFTTQWSFVDVPGFFCLLVDQQPILQSKKESGVTHPAFLKSSKKIDQPVSALSYDFFWLDIKIKDVFNNFAKNKNIKNGTVKIIEDKLKAFVINECFDFEVSKNKVLKEDLFNIIKEYNYINLVFMKLFTSKKYNHNEVDKIKNLVCDSNIEFDLKKDNQIFIQEMLDLIEINSDICLLPKRDVDKSNIIKLKH